MNTRDGPGGSPRLSGGFGLVILAGNEQFVGADYVDHAGAVGVEADLDGPALISTQPPVHRRALSCRGSCSIRRFCPGMRVFHSAIPISSIMPGPTGARTTVAFGDASPRRRM